MENLNIEKFNPTKAEITTLVEKYKALEIKGITDNAGYLAVDAARKELKRVRVNIQKTGKEMREEAVAFQKAVISKEKELVELVEPTEKILEEKQRAIDVQKEMEKRRDLLPERTEKLKALNVTADEDFLLTLDTVAFDAYYNTENAKFLEAQKEAMRIEQLKIDQQNREIEEKRIAQEKQAEQEKQKQEELAYMKRKEEERKAEEEKRQAEEKKRAEELQKQHELELEKARKEAEAKAIKDLEAKQVADALAAKAEQEKLEGKKKYTKFLADNGYTHENANEFITQQKDGVITLYKKVGHFKI